MDAEKGSFDWTWSNLDRSMERGEFGAINAIAKNNRDLENEVRAAMKLPLLADPVL